MEYEKIQRSKEGVRVGKLDLSCNIILAAAKFFVGITSNSITIVADGVNNLTDSISAILTIFGFHMEAMGEDEIHPYGHGRIEYVTGFLISLLIMGTGISVAKESIINILHPKIVFVSISAVGVFILSILIKLVMMLHCGSKNKKLKSPTLEAVRKDSFSDACISTMTLTALFIMPHCNLPLDGILGIIMAVYIFASGTGSFMENLTLLLGEGANRKTESELREIISECTEIESVKEITIHDYGPDRKIAVAEVNFIKSCSREEKRKTVDYIVQFCRDTMNIELSLYASLY